MKNPAFTITGLFWGCLSAALICLMVSAWDPRMPWGVILGLGIFAAWAFCRRLGWTWLPGVFLGVYTAAAAGSLLAGGSFHLALAGMCFALGSFELADDPRIGAASVNPALEGTALRRRLTLLGLAAGVGLVASELGHLLSWSIPFGGLGLAALAVLYGLVKLFGLLKEQDS